MAATVGNPPTASGINSDLQNCAVAMRDLMQRVRLLQQKVVALGLTGLENLGGPGAGYGSAANAANPGGVSDAQYVMNLASELNTVALCYYGTQFQGTTATNGVQFNFENAFTPLWGDQ